MLGPTFSWGQPRHPIEDESMSGTHLFRSKVLSIVRARGRANVVKGINKAVIITLSECKIECEDGVGVGRPRTRVPPRCTLPQFVNLKVAPCWRARRETWQQQAEKKRREHLQAYTEGACDIGLL